MKWFAIYTKPQFEIKVSQSLKSIGIHSYCPVYSQLKQYSDRKKKVTKPLLKSYVLVKINDKDRKKVFSVPGVVRYLFWLGKPAVIREEEIVLMENNLSGVYESISVTSLKKGDDYKIPDGPFKGKKGRIINLGNKKLQLELSSLGMLVTLKTA
jgi:transcription antitermination factor NusG